MEFRRHTLANGLDIVAECNPSAHSSAMGFFVRTGSRDETDEVAGVSHFLEHMMFKGTPRRSADDVNREFDEIGAHYNAYTSEEHTVYYASVLPEHQAACVDLLGDILRPSLREEDFEMEKKVILEEIQMYLDQPPYGMDDHVKQLCFGDHPIVRSVLGTAESVGALTAEQMREYFEARYEPSTITLAAAGDVDFEALVAQAEEACGGWRANGASRTDVSAAPASRFEAVNNQAATQQYALWLTQGPDAADPDRYAAKLLATAIGDDSGSRMYWELVDPGLVESCSLGHYEYEGVGMFYTWMSCAPDDIQPHLDRLHALLIDAQDRDLSAEELNQARNKVKSRVVLGNERPRSRLFSVGGNWVQRREYRSTRDDLRELDEVTVADTRRVLDRFPLTGGAVVTVGPCEAVAAPATLKVS
ncbi:MAG: pitrilysin family protein [Planctomycetota bacterium]